MEGPEFKPGQIDHRPLLLLIHCTSLHPQQNPELNPCVSHCNVNFLHHLHYSIHRFLWVIFFLLGIYFKSIPICSLILLIYAQKNRLSSEKLLREKIIYFSWSKKFVMGHTEMLGERWRWKVARGGRWRELFALKAKKSGKGAESWRASETWPAVGILPQLWALVWFEMWPLAEPSQTNPPCREQSLLRGLYGERDCVCVPTLKMLQKCLLSRWKNRDAIVTDSVTSQRGTASNGSGRWCSLSCWLVTDSFNVDSDIIWDKSPAWKNKSFTY